jgi:chemotaxis signal transduction protein
MQPKTVLHDYLTSLLSEPDKRKSITERTFGETHPEQDSTRAASCKDQSRADPNACGAGHGYTEAPARARPVGGIRAEESRVHLAITPAIPDWALKPFQILLFRIRGMNLAVRLNELDSIARWNGQTTPIPGQPRWQRGLFLHQQRKVSLVDLSGLIMPERSAPETVSLATCLLLVDGARRGLLCDSIQRPGLVRADDIRWSRNRKNRPWAYGIITENLAVLLDVNALLRILGTKDA